MPDTRRHRGQHPDDARLFNAAALGSLREAVTDLSWLEGRDYAEKSALEIVGNRYQLKDRQRQAILRCACSDAARERRRKKQISLDELNGRAILIDGYNLLITVESALSHGLVIVGRDGSYRDLASVHGTYRKVEETLPALRAIGATLAEHDIGEATWYLDTPVSNSGRLRAIIVSVAEENGWRWSAELDEDPDRVLSQSDGVVVSSDSVILDRCARWLGLAREVVERRVPDAWVVDLNTLSEQDRVR
jgi:hypothetical protein